MHLSDLLQQIVLVILQLEEIFLDFASSETT